MKAAVLEDVFVESGNHVTVNEKLMDMNFVHFFERRQDFAFL